jgi:hypothetical protein
MFYYVQISRDICEIVGFRWFLLEKALEMNKDMKT